MNHEIWAMHSESAVNDYHPVHIGSRQACDIFADLNRDLLIQRERSHA